MGMLDRDERLLQVGRRFLAETTPEPQPIDSLVLRVADIEDVHPETSAHVFWQLVRMRALDTQGRRLVEPKP